MIHARPIFRLACALGAGLFAACRARGGEIVVFAAASLSDALTEIAADFGRATGDTVRLNLGASSTLARQIREGAPADLFFSADEAKMDALDRAGLIEAGTRRSLLSNTLVIVVPAGSPLRLASANDLAGPRVRRLAVAEPATVPAGIYARAFLERKGLWAALAPKIVPVENVRAVLAVIEGGDADAGIVYRTDALASRKARIAWSVPREEGPPISYPAAVVRGGPNVPGAKRLLAWLESPAAAAVFSKYGFLTRP